MTQAHDPDRLAAIHRAAFTVPRPWSAEEIAAAIGAAGGFLCAEPGGFLIGRAIAGEAELLTVAVLPEARRSGIGGRLLAEFLREAGRRGATQAFLEVAADNRPALALYAGAGFAEAGRRRGYYIAQDGRRTDALLLSRPLGAGRDDFLT